MGSKVEGIVVSLVGKQSEEIATAIERFVLLSKSEDMKCDGMDG